MPTYFAFPDFLKGKKIYKAYSRQRSGSGSGF